MAAWSMSRQHCSARSSCGVCLITLLGALSFALRTVAEDRVDYLRQVKPLLAEKCYSCHGARKQKASLRLDTTAAAIHGGDSGAAIVPGDADGSELIRRVTSTDDAERMPPDGKPLKPEQIALLRTWISQNATAPSDEHPEADPRDHWAFRPIVRPPVPTVADANWVRNPIDAFVAHQHELHHLKPQVAASRELQIRRLYFDLIGLPPTEGELNASLADNSNDWLEQLAQRLLNDPRHGEAWARHWMDIWRYSDWWGLGDQLRNSQPHIWHWRDWIVESLNANMPYDEMLRLMLAADELYPDDLNRLRATGFLARNYFLFNRNQWMDESVEHVSKAFLGITMNCAKCHEHKFDPIEQVDYYRMRAIFEPYHVRMDMVPGEMDLTRDGIPCVFDAHPKVETHLFKRGQEGSPDKTKPIQPGMPDVLGGTKFEVRPVSLPITSSQPERRSWVNEGYLAAANKTLAKAMVTCEVATKKYDAAQSGKNTDKNAIECARAELLAAQLDCDAARAELTSVERRTAASQKKWAADDNQGRNAQAKTELQTSEEAAVRAERTATLARARAKVAELDAKLLSAAAEQRDSVQKELATAREALAKAEQAASAPVSADDKFTPLVGAKWTPTRFLSSTADDPRPEFPTVSTGRRSALAAWITDRRNPLAARVAVNHIWMRHMGTPLVPTVFEFGRKGSPPTNPELLEWLAAEFIDSDWDMKHLHRLIVTSATYQMSSSTNGCEANLAMDPDNKYWWRRNPIRLEAEAVRDTILSLAGTLDVKRGGPPIVAAEQTASTRRSLYFFHSNNDRSLFLTTFDAAAVKECYRRDESVVPQQALALTNSGLVLDSTEKIAHRLSEPVQPSLPLDDAAFVQRAFRAILGAPASPDELKASLAALEASRKLPEFAAAASSDKARSLFVWALLNHNDFLTIR